MLKSLFLASFASPFLASFSTSNDKEEDDQQVNKHSFYIERDDSDCDFDVYCNSVICNLDWLAEFCANTCFSFDAKASLSTLLTEDLLQESLDSTQEKRCHCVDSLTFCFREATHNDRWLSPYICGRDDEADDFTLSDQLTDRTQTLKSNSQMVVCNP